jgi:hypothetical protein
LMRLASMWLLRYHFFKLTVVVCRNWVSISSDLLFPMLLWKCSFLRLLKVGLEQLTRKLTTAKHGMQVIFYN